MTSNIRPLSFFAQSSSTVSSEESHTAKPEQPHIYHYSLKNSLPAPLPSTVPKLRYSARPSSSIGIPFSSSMGFSRKQADSDHASSSKHSSSSRGARLISTFKGVTSKRSKSSLLSTISDTTIVPRSRTPSGSNLLRPISVAPFADSARSDSVAQSTESFAVHILDDDDDSTTQQPLKELWRRNRFDIKLHPYPDEAPYPVSYESSSLLNDKYTTLLLSRINPQPSFFDYGLNYPMKVLDLGCGEGNWIVAAAKAWPNASIHGVDLVDVRIPEMIELEEMDEVKYRFLRMNFLTEFKKNLYPKNSFDLIRMADLSLSIPAEEWEDLLRRLDRILCLGGRIEIILDDVFFPYGKEPRTRVRRSMSPPPTPDDSQSLDHSFFDMDSSSDDENCIFSDDPNGYGPYKELGEDESSIPSVILPDVKSNKRVSLIDEMVPILEANETPDSIGVETAAICDNGCTLPNTPMVQPLTAVPGSKAWTSSILDAFPTPPDTSSTSQWAQSAASSKDMEQIYTSVLRNEYGLESQQSIYMLSTLKKVFGSRAAKVVSLHLKTQSETSCSSSSDEHTDSDRETRIEMYPMDMASGRRHWLKDMRRDRNSSSFDSSRLSDDSGYRDLPPTINSKAAQRLGISQPSLVRVPSTPSLSSGSSFMSVPTTPHVSQPAGLILLPSTLIPMSPDELEMHACKHMHQLLSCKHALADYVARQRDEDGNRLMEERDFVGQLFEYDSFRRTRFNWPLPPWDFGNEDPPSPPTIEFSSNQSSFFKRIFDKRHSGSSALTTSSEGASSSDGVHVRTIRVYHAMKYSPQHAAATASTSSASTT